METLAPETRHSIFHEIDRELIVARQSFPSNKHMLAALMEEVGELSRALLEGEGNHRVRREAIQVATVAIRIIEEGDADFAD